MIITREESFQLMNSDDDHEASRHNIQAPLYRSECSTLMEALSNDAANRAQHSQTIRPRKSLNLKINFDMKMNATT